MLLIAVLVLNTTHSQIFTPPGTGTPVSMSIEDGLLRINRAFYGILTSVQQMVGHDVTDSTADFYRREAYSAVNGFGQSIGAWYAAPDNHSLDMASDDGLKGTDAGDQPAMSLIETHRVTSSNDITRGKWMLLNQGVEHSNNGLRVLAQNPTQTDYNLQVAEFRFLRAYFNFEKKRLFNDGSWDVIEDDYAFAIQHLPTQHSSHTWPSGRPIVFTANAMLGKVHLYQREWSLALTNFNAVINSGQYALMSQMPDLWISSAKPRNREGIWTINFSSNGEANAQKYWSMGSEIADSSMSRGLNHPYISPWGCCGFFQPTQDLVDAYQTTAAGLPKIDGSWKTNHVTHPYPSYDGTDETTSRNRAGEPIGDPQLDPRLDFTVGRPGILFSDFHIMQIDYIRDLTYAGPYFTKKHIGTLADFGTGGWGNLTGVDYYIMRYADLLLMAAEAEVEMGNFEAARGYVNQVRQRAINMRPVSQAFQGRTRVEYTTTSNPAANYNIERYTSTWNSAALSREKVRFERRLELALEGHRMFDLWRWGTADAVISDYANRESRYRTYLSGVRNTTYWVIPSN